MSSQSLYRRYRPQRFDELLGQQHVTTALRNAAREDRTGHAYLFSGPRGTGKTTTARILAKALNCQDPGDDGEPCGVCDSCVEIARGSSMDVIEMDAASNNSVADVRGLLERVAFRSAGGRYRVYIVDEVHMLSTAASNALLKTLEEPPEHVVFVLATTEPEKVLPTIRSRTQHYEFSLLPIDDLAAYLGEITQQEKLDVEPEVLRLVARRGGGSVRDALSLLDQAVALSEGRLDVDSVRALVEATPSDRLAAIVDAVAGEDTAAVLEGLHAVLGVGADPRQVADDLLRYLRDVFLVSATSGQAQVEMVEEQERLAAQGTALGGSTVIRAIETLGDAAVDMRRAPDPRLVLEVALVRLSRREVGTRIETLLDRIERLERDVRELKESEGLTAPAPAAEGAEIAHAVKGPDAVKGPEAGGDPAGAPGAIGAEGAGGDEARGEPSGGPTSGSRPTLGAVRARLRAPGRESRSDPAQTEPGAGASPDAPPESSPPPSDATPPSEATPPDDSAPPSGAAASSDASSSGDAPPASSDAPPPEDVSPSGGSGRRAASVEIPAAPRAGGSDGPGATPLDYDDVVLAWPQALDRLRGKLKAMAREAQPIAVDGGTVVLGLPEMYQAVHRKVIEEQADAVAAAVSNVMGGHPVRIRVELHEGFLGDGGGAGRASASAERPPGSADPADGAAGDAGDPTADAEAEAEMKEMMEGGGSSAGEAPEVDSVSMFRETFGAEIVDEEGGAR